MKLSLSRIFETSQALATQAGQQLREPLQFLSNLGEQTLRALRNGLTFTDNFDGQLKLVDLSADVDQVVGGLRKTPTLVLPGRVYSTTSNIDSFGWWINGNSELVVNAGFTGAPTEALPVVLVILYGETPDPQ